MEFNKSSHSANKLVSVIMPAYNAESFIAKAIESVKKQKYLNWEIIIVDDGSTDRTPEIVKSYMKEETKIKFYRLDINSGPAVARNKALNIASGKYISFLDSDDIWFSEKLSLQIEFMEANNYNFTCTSYTKIDIYDNYLNKTVKTQKIRDYEGVLKKCPGNSTVIYNAEKLGKIEIPNIKKRNDYVMWLQIIKKEKYLHGLDVPLSSHRVRKEGISNKKTNLIKYHWKVYRNIEKLSFIKSIYLIFYWVFFSVLKLK